MKTVRPSSSTNDRIIWRKAAMPDGSRPFDGSSRISSSGSLRRLRATPSRCRIPIEYAFTFRSAFAASPTRSSAASIRPRESPPRNPAQTSRFPRPERYG